MLLTMGLQTWMEARMSALNAVIEILRWLFL